ncbi:type I restriction enzyme, R subunit [Peptoniphilus asaccharolyticus DSM 20463]|uniref:Type I restriction enzyme, R subunit n=1 Tax=Peptoniphilus asaccharolyticus DSM 20463 TaxID=573058 RepID=A0A1W1V3C3_PEPAS|nr:type I restriction endonuclease subunit R [Peptoniphilus asaccharolyticus]MBL7576197.1 DEAD/DEAH box helicase family protein [Peptoniphilus asaccharolyticus]SMB87793.1 type I restriction enzyme, R subunit [Peptoniphilus asaccharolyticus DSM 20463]
MLPEEKARIKIDKQLTDAGWDIVARDEYTPFNASAVKEALMQGNKESDYLLFVDDKAIAVVEAKAEDNSLGDIVAQQAEWYSKNPQGWVGLWFPNQIPLVYLANGNKIYFKNMLESDSEYVELSEMHSPKKMLQMLGKKSEYGALPRIEKKGLRDCQYDAEVKLEASLKADRKKALAILATGSGKTYLACLASYRLLNYTPTKRVLFLVDRNNLARQTETEFSLFDRTEKQKPMNELYQINRLTKPESIQGDIIISTIQKLFAVLTGQTITEDDEDKEDEKLGLKDVIKNEPDIVLGEDLKLPPDYFQFIIVDECHRSIYGKWKAVLDYFKDAKVLGLTATPTPEAYAYFNKNIVEEYTYEDSVVDGVNVPARVYRIITDATVHGGTINQGETVTDVNRSGEMVDEYKAQQRIDYAPNQLERSVINPNQIESVLKSYMESIYTDLYPEREENWIYIPKTLIFAKDDNHATKIVEIAKKVFAEKFPSGKVPDNFVQKITYYAGDSNALIRELRTEKDFRIAVTVTLVATGTDVKPLEVVLFMNDVKSDVLYTQMKGRGCRTLNEDKLREVTPNADNKNCFYIVDAVGVTESDKHTPGHGKGGEPRPKILRLDQLLERLSHGEVSDENLALLRDYCATIQKRYEDNPLFERHLNMFISDYGFSPRGLANNINQLLSQNLLPPYENISDENFARKNLIFCLISNLSARKKLLEMFRGYYAVTPEKEDKVIYKGFSKETAKSFISNFEQYLNDNADKIEALRIIYNSEDTVITYSMLTELQDKLIAENGQFTPYYIWKNYKILDNDGNVEELDTKQNIKALTHLIQLVRYAYKKRNKLVSLIKGYSQKFSLYCGQAQRELTDEQKEIMKQIADYIIEEGAISIKELNAFDTDLWRKGIKNFGAPVLSEEIITLAKFILKAA